MTLRYCFELPSYQSEVQRLVIRMLGVACFTGFLEASLFLRDGVSELSKCGGRYQSRAD
jgi:hypothetical protein